MYFTASPERYRVPDPNAKAAATEEDNAMNRREWLSAVTVVCTAMLFFTSARAEDTTETIVFVRHAEKPAQGLGQLSCPGLNRALSLPAVIQSGFKQISAIYAPNPTVQKVDHHVAYDYVRPLATIEPTAIRLGLPVNVSIGIVSGSDDDDDQADTKEAPLNEALESALTQPGYRSATLLVAWEHKEITTLARHLLATNGGNPDDAKKWHGADFDSIYVVRIVQTAAGKTASIDLKHEGLDAAPQIWPCPKDN